ncbi:hypothetical protein MMC22_010391 [Lobaria immixta]|nr:hypothetical protein [Lobaria immixta]
MEAGVSVWKQLYYGLMVLEVVPGKVSDVFSSTCLMLALYSQPEFVKQFSIVLRLPSDFHEYFRPREHHGLVHAIIIFGTGTLIYANYIYRYYILDEFSAYPEPVAAKLRRALFYTNIDLQPNNAVKYYRQALEVADEMGLDPFSDEIIGVKIQVAFLMEKLKQYEKAIEVLEIVHADCLRWIEELGGNEGNEGKRSRVLGKTVGISVKLGELYSSNHIDDTEAAEKKLIYSVTAVLKEKKRREEEGVKEGEGPWMSDEEVGAALELNNLSLSLLLQNPPPSPSVAPTSPAVMLDNATLWARKAVALADSIQDPARRTPECDHGCAVAMVNLGDLTRRAGDAAEARRWFGKGKQLSREIGFVEGMQMAEEGLRELGGVD